MNSIFFGPPGLIMLAAIIGAIGAFWAAQQQTEFERALKQKNEEIAALTRQTLESVTGGDSFPSISMFLEDARSTGYLAIHHHGKHPLYDVTARMVDLQRADSIKPQPGFTLEDLTVADTYLQIGTLVPKYTSFRGRIDLGDANRRDFDVYFVARNGGFTQNYRLAKLANGNWTSANRVVRDSDKRVMLEIVRDEFPRGKDGTVNW